MKYSDASRDEKVGAKLNNKCGKGLQNIGWNLLPHFFLFSITLMKQSASKQLHEWVHWQADFPPLPWGCFLHLMFCDKMLHRSKLEEPQLLTHVTVFASIMQSTACGGGRRRWEKKAFVTRGRGRNTNSSLKCILKKKKKHSRSFTWKQPQWWTWQSSKQSLQNVLTLKTLANRAQYNGEFPASFPSL